MLTAGINKQDFVLMDSLIEQRTPCLSLSDSWKEQSSVIFFWHLMCHLIVSQLQNTPQTFCLICVSPSGWANRGCLRPSGRRARPSGPTGACLWRSCCCPRCCPTRTPRPPPPRTRTTVTARCGISLTSRPWAVLRSWPWTWHWRTSTSRRRPRLPSPRKRRLKQHQRRKSPPRLPFDDMATPSPRTTIVTGRLPSRSNCQWMTEKKRLQFFVFFLALFYFFFSVIVISALSLPTRPPCLLSCVHWIKVVRRENVKASKRGGCVREWKK